MNGIPFVSAIPATWPRSKDVPFVSQKGNSPANDCGIACALMLAQAMGRTGVNDTVQKWAQIIDPTDDGTSAAQLADLLKRWLLTPVVGMSAIYPYITLVEYNRLPLANRSDQSGKTFPHWIVRLSDDTYHDPYHYGTAGANLKASATVLNDAMGAAAQKYIAAKTVQKVGIAERPKETTTVTPTSATVKAVSWNVRRDKTTKAESLGVLVKGDTVTVAGVVQGEGGEWYSIPLQAGGVTIKQAADEKTAQVVYMRADGFVSATPPANPTPTPTYPTSATAPYILGVHELNNFERAKEAIAKGARAVMVFNNAVGAYQLAEANPSAIIMHRRYISGNPALNATQMLREHGIDVPNILAGRQPKSASRVWMRGYNENDVSGYGSSPDEILKRAAFDVEAAKLVKQCAPNAMWVGGGYAHGNPDFTNQAVCDAVRKGYADAYNAGLLAFDIHSYDKCNPANPKDYKFYAPIWYPRRWQFLFERCGFDPKVRRIVSSEAGVEAGAGGFPWAKFTEAEFRAWCAYTLKVQQLPLVMGGVSYPSPFVAGTIYQWGNTNSGSGGWAGYALDGYVGALEAAYRGEIAAEKALSPLDIYAGALPPDDYVPTPKVLAEVGE